METQTPQTQVAPLELTQPQFAPEHSGTTLATGHMATEQVIVSPSALEATVADPHVNAIGHDAKEVDLITSSQEHDGLAPQPAGSHMLDEMFRRARPLK